MKISSDWHIHTHNSCDEACMLIPTLIEKAKEKGIERFGITDHLHTRKEIPDIEASRREYFEYKTDNFRFGIEVSVMPAEELKLVEEKKEIPAHFRENLGNDAELAIALTENDISKFGIEYVIGGTHWPIGVTFENRQALIRNYHRQNMFLATHSLIDIVAHPWWFHSGYWKELCPKYYPWFDDFTVIPKNMHDEFASAVVDNNKLVEINLSAMLLHPRYPEKFKKQYLEYLAELKSQGVKFTIGSDCHNANYEVNFALAEKMLDSVGISQEDICQEVNLICRRK